MTPGTVLLVEDGSGGTALAAARALGPAGWQVVLASAGPSYAAASRWCSGALRIRPAGDAAGHLDDVRGACLDERVDAVLPCGDAELLVLSRGRDRLPAVLPYPPHEVVRRALDKRELGHLAAAAGLATPRLLDLAAVGDGPVVVKAATREGSPAGEPGRTLRTGGDRARRRVAELAGLGLEPVIQEVVEGDLVALVLLLGPDGGVLARLQQVAERVYPVGAGNCVRGATEPVDEQLAGRALALLRTLGWTGLAQLELLRQPDGGYVLLDLNARLYGSLALAAAAGVDLPGLWLRTALGSPTSPAAPAAVGVRYQAREQDMRRAGLERRGGLWADLGGTLGAAVQAHQVWSRRDPAPAVRFAGQLARRVPARLAR